MGRLANVEWRRRIAGRCVSSIAALALFASGTAGAVEPATLTAPLRLEQVLEIARDHRAEIVAAHARARAFGQRPAIVSALEDPMISPAIDHLPYMFEGADTSVTVEQRFPLSRVRGNRRRVAKADAQRALADAGKVELEVELDAASAFLMLQERREMARILIEERALAEQFVRAATARYAAGSGTHADALRAEIEVARFDSSLRSSGADVRGAEFMLATSLGLPVETPIPALDGTIAATPPPDAAVVRDAALSRRPELRAGSSEVLGAKSEVRVMRSMYLPMAMVRTGPAYTMTDGKGWMVMVGISVPLWRGKLRAGVAEAEAMQSMAEADLAGMRRMIEGESLAAREQVVGSRERYLALRDEIIPRARQAIDPTLAGYSSGQLPLVSVIDAAQTLWNSQADLVSAQFDLGLAWARLHRAMGNEGARP